MTNHWVDIKNTDLAIIMGGNAAEAHPCGFKWVTEAKAHNKAKLVVVDPREVRLFPGYGLEGTLPDGLVGEILDQHVGRPPERLGVLDTREQRLG